MLCYGECSAQNLSTAFDALVTVVVVAGMWAMSEIIIGRANRLLSEEAAAGYAAHAERQHGETQPPRVHGSRPLVTNGHQQVEDKQQPHTGDTISRAHDTDADADADAGADVDEDVDVDVDVDMDTDAELGLHGRTDGSVTNPLPRGTGSNTTGTAGATSGSTAAGGDVAPWAWGAELQAWRERRAAQRKRFLANVRPRAWSFYAAYAAVAFGALYVVLKVSPQNPPANSLARQATDFLSVGADGVFDVLMYTMIVLETILLLMGLFCVTWPRAPAMSRPAALNSVNEHPRRDGASASCGDIDVSDTRGELEQGLGQDEQPGLIPQTCLIITAHNSCLTPEAQAAFEQTLRHALVLFPPSAIFVADNGPGDTPSDGTEAVCARISREVASARNSRDGVATRPGPAAQRSDVISSKQEAIRYVFIPEGNKSLAQYWVSEYWIPHLVRAGLAPDYPLALTIDDDVCLPPNFHVPLRTLADNPHIKAITFAIGAAAEDGKPRMLTQLQDLEYLIVGMNKQVQSRFGTTLYCHGAIGECRRCCAHLAMWWQVVRCCV